MKRITERPAVKKGIAVPSEGPIYKALYSTEEGGDPDARKRFEDGAAKVASAREALK